MNEFAYNQVRMGEKLRQLRKTKNGNFFLFSSTTNDRMKIVPKNFDLRICHVQLKILLSRP